MADWWQGAVLYQVYPRSFADGNGDGVGDLAGLLARLDYIAGLGVDGIWLSPVFPSPMRDFGYDVADYCDIDPLFGSLAEFDRLLAEAHRLGLKVIIDQVYSHSSDRHPWFLESRSSRDNAKADWYVWADPRPDGTPPNNWLAVFGGPSWSWDSRRRQYYFHNFLAEQPDLNFHTPAVQEAILDVARFWLGRGVDGFRLDVANFYCHDRDLRDNPARPHPNPLKPYWLQRPLYTRDRPETLDFVARLRRELDRWPGAMAVAEIGSEDPVGMMVAYTDGPERFHTAYSFVFLREPFGAGLIRAGVEEALAASATAWPSWAFSNHDVARVVSRWGDGVADPRAFAKVLIALLTTLRGTAFLYQGEELGLPQSDVPFERLRDPEGIRFWPEFRGRDGCRTPLPWQSEAPFAGFSAVEPWLPADPAHRALAVDRQDGDSDSVLAFTRAFLHWRRHRPALITGAIRFLDSPEPVLLFVRESAEERLLCAWNLGPAPVRLPCPDAAAARACDAPGLHGKLADEAGVTVLDLPGYGGLIAAMAG